MFYRKAQADLPLCERNSKKREVVSALGCNSYSTVTDFAKFRGWSTLSPFATAT